MTTYNHTAIPTGAAANASTFNTPLGALDAAIGDRTILSTAAKNSLVAALNELSAGKQDVLPDQAANLVYTGPTSGGAQPPAFRALVKADIPQLGNAQIEAGAGIDWSKLSKSGALASEIGNTPAGGVAATTVQGAINELDSEKAATYHSHTRAGVTDLTDQPLDTFAEPTDTTNRDASALRHGLFPKLAGDALKVINGLGVWVKATFNVKINGGLATARSYLDIRGTGVAYYDDAAGDAVRITITGGGTGGGASVLNDLTDVNSTGESDKDILAYNAGVPEYQNRPQSVFKLDDFGTPDDNTDLNATTGHHGLMPKLSGNGSDVLRGDGTFGTTSGSGHVIQYEGANLANRPTFNITGGGVQARDNSANSRTDITVLTKYPCQGRLSLLSGTPLPFIPIMARVPSSTDISTNVVTFADNHGFMDGQAVLVSATGGGLTAGTTYYMRAYTSSLTATFHTTEAGAKANTSIVDLTASITATIYSGTATPNRLYFVPYKGDVVSLYDGANWIESKFPEISLDTSAFGANSNFDIFLCSNSGTFALEAVVWTSGTTRTSEPVLQNGVPVKNGDATRRYIGTIRTTLTTGYCEQSYAKSFVWNMYNREPFALFAQVGYNGGWYADTTGDHFRGSHGDTDRSLIVVGYPTYASLSVFGSYSAKTQNGCGGGIGIDSTTVATGLAGCMSAEGGIGISEESYANVYLTNGYHYLQILDWTNVSNTTYAAYNNSANSRWFLLMGNVEV